MNKLWFKARGYGWGWTPCSIEGWLVVIGFVMGLILLSSTLEEGDLTSYLLGLITLIALVIIIGFKKGEKPHWNWGKK